MNGSKKFWIIIGIVLYVFFAKYHSRQLRAYSAPHGNEISHIEPQRETQLATPSGKTTGEEIQSREHNENTPDSGKQAPEIDHLAEANTKIQALSNRLAQMKQDLHGAELDRQQLTQKLAAETVARRKAEQENKNRNETKDQQQQGDLLKIAEISRLRGELEKSKSKLIAAEAELAKAQLRADAMYHYGKGKDENMAPCAAEVEALQKTLQEKGEMLDRLNREKEAQLGEGQQLVREMISLKESDEVQARELLAAKNLQEQTATTLQQTQTRLDASEALVASLQKSLEEKDGALQSSVAQQAEIVEKLKLETERSTRLQADLTQQAALTGQSDNRIKELEEIQATMRSEIEKMKSVQVSDSNKTKQAITAREKAETALQAKETELGKSRKAEDTARSALTKAEKQLKDLTVDLQKNKEELQKTKKQRDEMEKTIAAQQKSLNDLPPLQKQLASLQGKLQEQQQINAAAQQKLQQAEEQLVAMEKEKVNQTQEVDALTAKNKELIGLIQEARTAHEADKVLQQQQEQSAEKARLTADLEKELATKEDTINQLQQANTSLRAELQGITQELTTLKEVNTTISNPQQQNEHQ